MNKQEVLELIQAAVRPLREKIEHLQKENQKLKIQITTPNHQPQRLRSSTSTAIKYHASITESPERARSPSTKKKDQKPIWNPAGRAKQQAPAYKSPPPVDKNKVKPVSPKVAPRAQSKQKKEKPVVEKRQSSKKNQVEYLSFEKPEPAQIKIKGGQRFSEQNSNNASHLKPESIKDSSKALPKHNGQNTQSQQHSQYKGSQLLAHEQQS